MIHPLLDPPVLRVIERAASAHAGQPWRYAGFTDLADRASHPCGILHGSPFAVFAKLDDGERLVAEQEGLALLRDRAGVAVPAPVAEGVVPLARGSVLLTEALVELPRRAPEDWRAIGRMLAALHAVPAPEFGVDRDTWFGRQRQDNRPAASWPDFFVTRRLLPGLRAAVRSGHLPGELAAGVERLAARLPDLAGPEPAPALLHGDAQQNNIVSTAAGPVAIDAGPYFGHPEIDLASVDLFAPVPDDLLAGYGPVDAGFAGRRALWRLPAWLAVVAEAGGSPFGRAFLRRIAEVVA